MKKQYYRISEALKRRRRLNRDLEIVNRYLQGYSACEIARRFALDRCHVLKIIRELRNSGFDMSARRKEKWPMENQF